MSYWQDLSPGVRRYIIFAAVLFGLLLLFRRCTGPSTAGDPPPRGVQRQNTSP
jgi:hypothetical protein